MSKEVKVTNAEVITFYQSEDYLKEIETEKGTIMSFQIKTRINDRVENSPLIFERCSFFADSADKIEYIRNTIKPGNIVELKGYADRRKGQDKDGKSAYYDSLNVREISPINVSKEESTSDDDLPF
jgi:hypothetical protein